MKVSSHSKSRSRHPELPACGEGGWPRDGFVLCPETLVSPCREAKVHCGDKNLVALIPGAVAVASLRSNASGSKISILLSKVGGIGRGRPRTTVLLVALMNRAPWAPASG